MEKEYKLSEESAWEQMNALMKSYDIDKRDVVIDQGEAAIDTILNRLVRAIRTGQMEVQGDGSVLHTLAVPKGDMTTLTYRRLNGIALKARDKAKEPFDKDCALMGSLCNMPASAMADLDPLDISIFQRLGTLFMVV
jgi:hypothetical protein